MAELEEAQRQVRELTRLLEEANKRNAKLEKKVELLLTKMEEMLQRQANQDRKAELEAEKREFEERKKAEEKAEEKRKAEEAAMAKKMEAEIKKKQAMAAAKRGAEGSEEASEDENNKWKKVTNSRKKKRPNNSSASESDSESESSSASEMEVEPTTPSHGSQVRRTTPVRKINQVKGTTPVTTWPEKAVKGTTPVPGKPEVQVEGTTPEMSYAERMKKPPPITMQGAERWREVRSDFQRRGIAVEKAKVIGNDLRLFPAGPEDYRNAIKYLVEKNEKYYTYSLKEEVITYAVIKGLNKNMKVEDIKQDLLDAGLQDGNCQVARMTSTRTKEAMSLFQVRTSDLKVYEITRLGGLVVKIERKNKPVGPAQCYNCQRYGHTQRMCTMPARCVKCAGLHASRECRLEKPAAGKCNASCVLCAKDGHPASFKGCEKYMTYAERARAQKEAASPGKKEAPQRKEAPQQKETTTKKKDTSREEEILKKITPSILQAIMNALQACNV